MSLGEQFASVKSLIPHRNKLKSLTVEDNLGKQTAETRQKRNYQCFFGERETVEPDQKSLRRRISIPVTCSTIDWRCNKKNENGNEQQQLFEYPNEEECVVDVNVVGSEIADVEAATNDLMEYLSTRRHFD